jgi:hypothetical protein
MSVETRRRAKKMELDVCGVHSMRLHTVPWFKLARRPATERDTHVHPGGGSSSASPKITCTPVMGRNQDAAVAGVSCAAAGGTNDDALDTARKVRVGGDATELLDVSDCGAKDEFCATDKNDFSESGESAGRVVVLNGMGEWFNAVPPAAILGDARKAAASSNGSSAIVSNAVEKGAAPTAPDDGGDPTADIGNNAAVGSAANAGTRRTASKTGVPPDPLLRSALCFPLTVLSNTQ